MYYVAIALLVIGALLLVIGYRKNSRNMLVLSALLLLLSGSAEDLVAGFQEGFNRPAQNVAEHSG